MDIIEMQEFMYTTIKSCTNITSGKALLLNNIIIVQDIDKSILSIIHCANDTNHIFAVIIEDLFKAYSDQELGNVANHDYIYYELKDLYNRYSVYDNYDPIYTYDNINELEDFTKAINTKAAFGLQWAKLSFDDKRFMFPVSKYITPITKQDKLSLFIYNDTDITSVYKYIMYKKIKKTYVDIYTRIYNF